MVRFPHNVSQQPPTVALLTKDGNGVIGRVDETQQSNRSRIALR